MRFFSLSPANPGRGNSLQKLLFYWPRTAIPCHRPESPTSERPPIVKLIVAIIRPEKLEAVQKALNDRDVYLMTVSDVRGCGMQRGYTEVYRSQEFQIRLLSKLKLEIAVNEAFVEATIEAIVHSARTGDTGQIGDGKIFVLPMEDCVRIRTGERGGSAIGP
jgi:nitrogen regulatory protein P-II 2